ncbi:hypothetical protein EVAR_30940_1 [Eumeta japonica]|uniref:Uncharacterized protein n=1 Tax=Eumeta variegata TaxID=151549 RepID=A0A4C1V485_EUMVA|nr:hypothetical protein EVAR_30940_1 [Eumeta japonica]
MKYGGGAVVKSVSFKPNRIGFNPDHEQIDQWDIEHKLNRPSRSTPRRTSLSFGSDHCCRIDVEESSVSSELHAAHSCMLQVNFYTYEKLNCTTSSPQIDNTNKEGNIFPLLRIEFAPYHFMSNVSARGGRARRSFEGASSSGPFMIALTEHDGLLIYFGLSYSRIALSRNWNIGYALRAIEKL